jgi:protein involved in polysaccharide export with SLBB domain
MSLLSCNSRHLPGWLGVAALVLALAGCETNHAPAPAPSPSPVQSGTTSTDTNFLQTIPLQVGDTVQVEITGTPTKIDPLQLLINESGTITLAYIKQPIQAAGKTSKEIQEIIRAELVPQIYTFANVSVTPFGRYFYVGGYINPGGTGKQLYTGHTTLSQAISAAGGFSEFAAKKRVQVTRLNGKIFIVDCMKALKDPTLDIEIFPGDRIYVDRRTFIESVGFK